MLSISDLTVESFTTETDGQDAVIGDMDTGCVSGCATGCGFDGSIC
jgi:hypothetical protein